MAWMHSTMKQPLNFMVIGLPRSGTTWASVWLTTDFSFCTHDPLYHTHYQDWDTRLSKPGRWSGVSCTGIFRHPKWLNSHPARKLILHRPLDQVNASLRDLNFPPIQQQEANLLSEIDGMHVPFSCLWDQEEAIKIWDYLGLPGSMDKARHQELKHIEMQPQFQMVRQCPEVGSRLLREWVEIAARARLEQELDLAK